MYPSTASPADAYTKVGIETGVSGASPHKLILMLFDGAIMAIGSAARQMQANQIAEKGQSISKAIDIITNGLDASLDMKVEGELGARLSALYEYMCARLLHAGIKNDRAALDEVAGLLAELRSAWEEIADDPAVLSANNARR
ncbi:MAG: flagellar export chaperone FliS [Rhodocyclales bacterium]|nr:flagellar export chaperone FliS [Rhodocyclales bacterium]